jgi:hypothetical protein
MAYAAPKPEWPDYTTGPSPGVIVEMKASAAAGAPTREAARARIDAAAKAGVPITRVDFDLAYSDQTTEWQMKEKYKLEQIGALPAWTA